MVSKYSLNLPKHAGEISPVIPMVREGEELEWVTQSICPYCYRILPAIIVERENRLYIRKACPEHGEIEELYWGDVKLYKKFLKWESEGRGPRTIYTPLTQPCPFSCGLCPLHKNHTALINMVVTNRCNLSCWYCFYYADKAGYVYEPRIEDLLNIVRSARKQAVSIAVQLTGGEPTLREDLVDIVKALRMEGVRHIQLNTNGLKFAELYLNDPVKAVEYVGELRRAGVNTVYMSFDGVTPVTNWKNHWEAPYILEVFRKAEMTSTVLVPTVIRGVNDHELGAIVFFAAKHIDVVRGVNFQPVSLTGMMKRFEREKYRITIPEVIKRIEEQTNGMIDEEAWYPVPITSAFSRVIEGISGKFKFEMDNHPLCGAATYVYVERSHNKISLTPVTHFIDVEGLFEYFEEKWAELIKGSSRLIVGLRIISSLKKFIDDDRRPKDLDLGKLLFNVIVRRSYEALGEIHYKLLFLGIMHFMDLYNYDVQRVMRCNIHYGLPDGRLIPFCTFNILEDVYREVEQKNYGVSLSEYAEKHGLPKGFSAQKYVRDRERLESTEIYKRAYEGVVNREINS